MHSFSEGLFLHHATASFARSYALGPARPLAEFDGCT
jgi:hypothetical protein